MVWRGEVWATAKGYGYTEDMTRTLHWRWYRYRAFVSKATYQT